MTQKQIPKNWQEVELKEIIECLDSKRIPITESNRTYGKIPYYGANGQVGWINEFIFDEQLLLLAEDGGSWGKGEKCSYIINGKSWVNNHAHVLKINNGKTTIKFLMYWLNNSNLNKYISGTTRGKLNQKAMNSIKIPLPFFNGKPDLETQKKIVSILEKAETLKLRNKKVNELFDEYLRSVFAEMFFKKGFKEIELGDKKLLEIQSGGTPSRNKKEYWDNGTIPWIGSTACKDLDINEAEQFITEEGLKNSSAKLFPRNTVLVALVGATIGKTGILNFECSTNQNIAGIIIKDNKKISPDYLFFSLKQLYQRFMSLSGDTFKMANLSFVRSLKIPLPPIELQEKFASIVEYVEKLKEKQKRELENAEELFNSLMQKAFRGELVR